MAVSRWYDPFPKWIGGQDQEEKGNDYQGMEAQRIEVQVRGSTQTPGELIFCLDKVNGIPMKANGSRENYGLDLRFL